MLCSRKLKLHIANISLAPIDCIVVFNYFDEEPETQFEPHIPEEIEIVDVFDVSFDSSKSVYSLLSDEEENDLLDYLWMLKEDKEC